jgi:cytochrome c biogenesis protein CcdA
MFSKLFINFKKKSLKERFLLFIGILFFLIYLTLGLIIIFWKAFPLQMEKQYRIAFGVLLIVYAFIRFLRFFNSNKEEYENN